VQQTGALQTVDGAQVAVRGDFIVNGGDSRGHLDGGRLELHGNLTVSPNAPNGFSPGGTHTTYFTGPVAQVVTMGASDSTSQRLNQVSVQNQALVRFASETHVVGDFIVAGVIEVLGRLELWDQATFSQTSIVRYGMIQQPETGTMIAFSYLFTDPFGAAGQPGRRLFFRDQTQ
jgi:hypothetical protein